MGVGAARGHLPVVEPEDPPSSARLPLLDQVARQESGSCRPEGIVVLLAARAMAWAGRGQGRVGGGRVGESEWGVQAGEGASRRHLSCP
eukprot:1798416-Prymnesium_polylepis.1